MLLKLTCNLKIRAASRMVGSSFHTEKPHTLVTTLQNLVAWVTWYLGFVRLWNEVRVLDNQVLRRRMDA